LIIPSIILCFFPANKIRLHAGPSQKQINSAAGSSRTPKGQKNGQPQLIDEKRFDPDPDPKLKEDPEKNQKKSVNIAKEFKSMRLKLFSFLKFLQIFFKVSLWH
jgi:hypothetical protein